MKGLLPLLFLAPLLLAIDCRTHRGPDYPGPGGAGGAPSGDRCERGFHAAEKVCPKKLRPDWTDVCRSAEAHGIDMQPDCLEKAKDCAEVTVCETESP